MFRKSVLAPMMLSLGLVLLASDFADAQGLRGRRAQRSNNYNTVSSDSRAMDMRPMYDYARTSNYFTPLTQNGEPIAPESASIRIILPEPNAKVLFDGAPTQQMGNDRWFHTPPLQSPKASYKIRATWMQGGREMSQERDVQVSPGRVSVVRFDVASKSEQIPGAQRLSNPTAQDQILEGKILKVEQDHFILETRDNRQVHVYTSPQTRYTLNQNAAAFADIKIGNSVNVNFTRQGERHNATAITIRP